MTHAATTSVLLIANPEIRRAKVWSALKHVQVHAFRRQDFSISHQLPADAPVLLYQVDARLADTVSFLNRVSKRQHDLCVIVIGRDISEDGVATLLRHGAHDYLTWPCPVSRLTQSMTSGLENRRTRQEVRNLSDELARLNHALTNERDTVAQHYNNLSDLHHFTRALAGSSETESIVQALFATLPSVIAADLIGLVQTNPEQVWTWARSREPQQEHALRAQLLDRVVDTKSRTISPNRTIRLVGAPHLSLVSKSDHPPVNLREDVLETCDLPLALGSHRVGMLRVERTRPFTEQDQHLLTTVAALLALSLRNADVHRQLHAVALRDPLTDVLNRGALDGPLTREFKTGLRYGTSACLMLLDLDYFKTVNERLGHVAGDEVLKRVAMLTRDAVRDIDSVARYGGEEFAIVLPHTDLKQAEALAERIRIDIEGHAFDLEDGHVRITASLGLASLHDSTVTTVAGWISAADSALYEAKSRGRNRVVTHTTSKLSPARAVALCAVA